jgi:urease accessory protein
MKTSLLLLPFALLVAGPALAHTGHGEVSGFAAGLSHPIGGLDHLLAMAAVGLWSAIALPRAHVFVAPIAFVTAMLAGAVLAFAGLALPAVEGMIAASVLILGLMVATRAKLPVAAGAGVAALFALFHGFAHGAEAAGGAAAYMAGFAVSTAAIHLGGVALGLPLTGRRLAEGAVGGAIALAGVALIAG